MKYVYKEINIHKMIVMKLTSTKDIFLLNMFVMKLTFHKINVHVF